MVTVLLGVLAAGYFAFVALAATPLAAPSITVFPPNPSASMSASFQFTGPSGATFECRLDPAPSFTACTSPKTYTGLTLASHVFRVRAVKAAQTSAETSYTWLVAAPAIPTITAKPSNPTNQTTASFSFTTNASNATFVCRLAPTLPYTACASPKSYSGLAAGSHTFDVEAVGVSGSSTGTSSPASWTWVIDLTPPAAPSITSGPSGLTASTSASFAFTGEGGASFQCALDSTASPVACTSPKSYSGLAQGAHTFYVRQTDTAGNTGVFASRSWTVDTVAPPAPSITSGPLQYPPVGRPSTSASFQFTDSESGVSFLCSLDGGGYAACSSPKSYTGLAQGSHTLRVEAKDAAGNVSGPSAPWTWFVDTVAPNQPTLTSFPSNPSSLQSARFAWTDTDPTPGSGIATYACKLDGGSYQPCSSPKTYSGLSFASHIFLVVAIDWAGNTSQARTYTWTVSNSTGQPYAICPASSPCAVGPLYPGGPAASINVTFSSPNAGAGRNGTRVSSLVVSITSISSALVVPNPCTAADYVLTQFGGTYPFYVPFGASSLSSLGFVNSALWPSIRMLNRADTVPGNGSGNQNACKGATVHLSFQGTP